MYPCTVQAGTKKSKMATAGQAAVKITFFFILPFRMRSFFPFLPNLIEDVEKQVFFSNCCNCSYEWSKRRSLL